jgi:hypothetical protein
MEKFAFHFKQILSLWHFTCAKVRCKANCDLEQNRGQESV